MPFFVSWVLFQGQRNIFLEVRKKKKVREIHEVTDSEVHALLQLDVYMCIFVYAHLWV